MVTVAPLSDSLLCVQGFTDKTFKVVSAEGSVGEFNWLALGRR